MDETGVSGDSKLLKCCVASLTSPFMSWRVGRCRIETPRVPMKYRLTLELALANAERQLLKAERLKDWFLQQQGRIGGRATKADTLHEIINNIVQQRPDITERELLGWLKKQQGLGIIQDLDERAIWFTTKDGRSKSAAISGLKDRLSRAKGRLLSR
jgi:hypothetical protein